VLEALRADPTRSAILTDVDGTLAPIVEQPGQARVPDAAREVLGELAQRFGLVGCISGRQASEARRLVGLPGIVYAGNHGLELLRPGEEQPRLDPGLERPEAARAFLEQLDRASLSAVGLRTEDKGPIQALHWRGAEDEDAGERRAREIAAEAERSGLFTHWGRKVLELRPTNAVGKDVAVGALIAAAEVRAAAYAGDDRTDLDAFRRLRELRDGGELEVAICVGVLSAEAPPKLADDSDLTVEGPPGWLELLRELAG
jgi:trehalose 6-phosphate phosphatase